MHVRVQVPPSAPNSLNSRADDEKSSKVNKKAVKALTLLAFLWRAAYTLPHNLRPHMLGAF